jgi:predicted transposase/invertase (TIGR01784 family)
MDNSGFESSKTGENTLDKVAGLDREDHDSPWKEALEVFFQPFMEFLYPDIAQLIDWRQAAVFMDKELQKITNTAETSRRYADKLVKVRFLDGAEQWIYIHIEVQGKPESRFAERMFEYFYRIRDRFAQPVISLAVLTDTQASFRPNHFHYERAGCSLQFQFISVKLLDWQHRMDELLNDKNPFGLLIAAQLTAKLVKDSKARADNLVGFYRLVINKDLDRELIRRLIVFLEWMVYLPAEITVYYNELVEQVTEETNMPYISLIERKGIAQGLEQGLEQGIGQGRAATLHKLLQLKFGDLADEYEARLKQADAAELDLWTERVLFADSVEAVFA